MPETPAAIRILGLETSCDECAASVVVNGTEVLSNVVFSQIDTHKLYGGVVPEIAARMHTESIQGVCDQALRQAGYGLSEIDAVAVTQKPGLIGSLLIGISFAKGLALAAGKPLIAVDHILAHLYAPRLEAEIDYPYLGVLLSGGHTMICLVEDFHRVEVLGATIDDACGEALDKVAKHYQLGYPGGPAVDRLAQTGDPDSYVFPKPNIKSSSRPLDFSFSGFKTAAIWQSEQFLKPGRSPHLPDLLASYQKGVFQTILDRIAKAVEQTGQKRIVIGGGVAANSYLRAQLAQSPWEIHTPSLQYCTDNAAMIAGIAYQYSRRDLYADWDFSAYSRVEEFRSLPKVRTKR